MVIERRWRIAFGLRLHRPNNELCGYRVSGFGLISMAGAGDTCAGHTLSPVFSYPMIIVCGTIALSANWLSLNTNESVETMVPSANWRNSTFTNWWTSS